MATGIYDRVPCKSLARSKFNLSHRSSFTGDMGIIYPTLVEEAIAGDVWKLGSEHVLQFMPLISPMLQNVKIDKHAFFVPFRLLYENWTKFFMMKDSHGKEYTTPLPSLQDLYKAYTEYDGWHDLYRYVQTMTDPLYSVYWFNGTTFATTDKPSEVTTVLANCDSAIQNKVLSKFDHFDTGIGVSNAAFVAVKCMPWTCGNLLDMLGFPAFDEQFHDKFGVVVIEDAQGFHIRVFDKTVDKWVTSTGNDTDTTIKIDHVIFHSNGGEHELSYWLAIFKKEYTSCAPILSYWYIYDEWYRRSDVDDMFKCKWLRDNQLGVSDDEFEVDANNPAWLSFVPHTRTYHKDYFTASLKTAQSGTAPALPISGILPVGIYNGGTAHPEYAPNVPFKNMVNAHDYAYEKDGSFGKAEKYSILPYERYPLGIDLAKANTFDITDLRLANAIQRFQELSNVAGTRYTSFLKMMYGTSPNDDVLQRPDYFGHIVSSVKFGQVESSVATSDDPLGTRAGKGNSIDVGYFRAYHPKEPGVIMTTMSMVPESTYSGQGIQRQWQRKSKFDYYDSQFSGIGEQEIKTSELFLANDQYNHDHVQDSILGFIGRFDEYRSRTSNCKGLMRNSKYNTFTLDRYFVNTPSLNSDFVHVKVPKGRFLAVPTEPTFVCYFGNIAHVFRPMPEYAVPRL